jgi:hypothetical protein
MGDHGPFAPSLEKPGLQGKVQGVRDPRPLGAGMGSSGFFLIPPLGRPLQGGPRWVSPVLYGLRDNSSRWTPRTTRYLHVSSCKPARGSSPFVQTLGLAPAVVVQLPSLLVVR